MERYYKFRPDIRSETDMVEDLRRAGVRACIIGWDAAAGSGGPPLTNDYVADLVRRFPDTFPGGWAMVDPWRGREALRWLQSNGEYDGFARMKPRRYDGGNHPTTRSGRPSCNRR